MAIDREKTSSIVARYDEIMSSMADPSITSDTQRYLALNKEMGELEEKVTKIRDYDDCQRTIEEALEQNKNAEKGKIIPLYDCEGEVIGGFCAGFVSDEEIEAYRNELIK